MTYAVTGHTFSVQTVASGAGRGVCSCGWCSPVSDDATMFEATHYSANDIRRDWQEHARQAHVWDVTVAVARGGLAGGGG